MNWFIPTFYNNREYKNVKCRSCGTEIILNPNIKSRDDEIKPFNLDNSPHYCLER
jgi:hypothetical protein